MITLEVKRPSRRVEEIEKTGDVFKVKAQSTDEAIGAMRKLLAVAEMPAESKPSDAK